MSTNNGQPADETTFNNAYLSRLSDSDTIGKIDLANADTANITDVQATINQNITDIDQNRTDIDSNDVELADHESRISTNETDIAAIQGDYVDLDTNQTIAGEKTFSDDAVFNGDLTVNGTTTTVNSATLDVTDKNITVNNGGSDATSEGAGITVERTGTDGSLVYEDALDNKFKLGALGSEEEISGIVKDTLANLQALVSPSSSNLYFATDTLEHFRSDGTSLQPLGSGSGGGGLDNWLAEDFETTVAADFSTGNNATFGGGGTLDGVLSDETTSPLSGTSSIKYVAGSSSINDYIASPVVDVDIKQRENDSGVTFYFTWDGTTDIECVIWDETNSEKLNSILDVIDTAGTSKRYSATFYPPSTCTEVRYGFHFLVAPSNGDELIFDDVEFSTNPFVYKEINRENVFSARVANNGTASITTQSSNFITSATRSAVGIVDIVFEAGFFSVTPSVVISNDVNGFQSIVKTVTTSGFTVDSRDTASSGNDCDFSVVVQRQGADYGQTTENVITPATSNATDWIEFTPTLEGGGTITGAKAFYKQVLSDMEIKISLTTGTVDATTAAFVIPNNHSVNTSVVTEDGKMGVGVGYQISGGSSNLPTGGDYFEGFLKNTAPTKIFITPSSASGAFETRAANGILNSSAEHTFYFKGIPIEGWSSDAKFLAAVPVKKIAYIRAGATNENENITGTASYKTRSLVSVDGNTDFISIDSDQLLLSKGLYSIENTLGSLNAGWLDMEVYDDNGSVQLREFENIAYSISSSEVSFNQVKYELLVAGNELIEFRTKTGVGGDEFFGTVKITKLR